MHDVPLSLGTILPTYTAAWASNTEFREGRRGTNKAGGIGCGLGDSGGGKEAGRTEGRGQGNLQVCQV